MCVCISSDGERGWGRISERGKGETERKGGGELLTATEKKEVMIQKDERIFDESLFAVVECYCGYNSSTCVCF